MANQREQKEHFYTARDAQRITVKRTSELLQKNPHFRVK